LLQKTLCKGKMWVVGNGATPYNLRRRIYPISTERLLSDFRGSRGRGGENPEAIDGVSGEKKGRGGVRIEEWGRDGKNNVPRIKKEGTPGRVKRGRLTGTR